MSKFKKFLTSPVTTVGAFILAAGLLLFSTVGGARAALTYTSDTYTSRLTTYEMGVALMENGSEVSSNNYSSEGEGEWSGTKAAILKSLVPEGETFHLGQKYPEVLTVTNTGSINEYVRVTITKSWKDANNNKVQTLTPDLIELNLVGNGWVVDETSSTDERTVLYYSSVLGAGETSAPITDTIRIDNKIINVATVDQTTGAVTFDYEGVQFNVTVSVDAVQEHNAEDAILSSWGRHVSVSGGALSLN